jgi:hypothetical protein
VYLGSYNAKAIIDSGAETNCIEWHITQPLIDHGEYTDTQETSYKLTGPGDDIILQKFVKAHNLGTKHMDKKIPHHHQS